MMKRLLALLLAVMMVFSLAACSSSSSDDDDTEDASPEESEEESEDEEEEESEEESEETETEEEEDLYYNTTGYPICDEEIEITIAGQTPYGLEDWTKVVVVDEWAERLGIRISDCLFYDSDSWSTQLTLMIASDDLPDLLINAQMNYGDVLTWGNDGYFVDIAEYLDLMPNMVTHFEEYPDLEAYITTTEGNIYGLTKIKIDMTDRMARTFINQVWLDNLGLELPTSVDELYETLTAFYEQDANGNGDATDEIPFHYTGDDVSESTLMTAFGIPYASLGTQSYVLMTSGDEVILANTTDNYKAYLSYMAQMYAEGLIEQEAYTITSDEVTARAQNDLYGFYGTGGAPWVTADTTIDYDSNFSAIACLTSEYDETGTIALKSVVQENVVIAIASTSEYPEAICRFLDYFYTEEGIICAQNGYEGLTFEWVYDETLDADVNTIYSEYTDGTDDYNGYYYMFNDCFSLAEQTPVRDILFNLDVETLESDDVVLTYGWAALMAKAYIVAVDNGAEVVDAYPRVSYTTEQTNERTTLYTDILSYLEQSKAQFITGEIDVESDWDTYLSTLDSMGLDELLAIEQEAYDNYLASSEG